MQWQQMDWPILIDPLNLLELSGVPVVTAIDEHGVAHQVTQENFEAEFIERDFAPPSDSRDPDAAHIPDLDALQAKTANGDAGAYGEYGAGLYLWGGIDRIDDAVDAFRQAVALSEQEGRWHFRLGVCLRTRHESIHRKADDFQEAIIEWGRALELDPNQYIWRRRVQQYGPRLEKPYPFYDWVEQAREEIAARGEVPVALTVEPAGAEFASPLQSLESAEPAQENPDPQGQIIRDDEHLVRVEAVSVPAIVAPGDAARVHLIFRPEQSRKAHWNNEVDDLLLWVDAPAGWSIEHSLHTVANPAAPVSRETRRLDFEIVCEEQAPTGEVRLPAYVLYYVCEDEDGTCLYRRQDVEIPLRVDDN